MRRTGHARPVGTITAPWRIGPWEGESEPQLHDFVAEVTGPRGDPAALKRAYLVVGVEEPTRGTTWRITFERLAWPPDRIDWTWWRKPR